MHEKLPGDRRSDHARRETLWIDLEDVIASKYVLGQHIQPSTMIDVPVPYSEQAMENLFKLAHKKGKAELHGNMSLRIQTALEHHACANGGERCEKCTKLFNHWDVHGAWDVPEVQ